MEGKHAVEAHSVAISDSIVADEKHDSLTPSAASPTNVKSATSASEDEEDTRFGRRLTTKLDVRIIPILGFLYLVSFLDRSNIANARLFGLEKSLNMPSNGFNTCLWIFYVPFVIVEVPSNLIMSMPKISPRAWLGGMMAILGVVSMCQGLTSSYGGLLACRFIMGVLEAGLMPGAALIIGSYYRRTEFSIRFAFFICFALAGNAFSGLLAYAIKNLEGRGGYESWRWIFIIEGLLTLAFGIGSYFVIPGFPQDATFLTDRERAVLLARLRKDRGEEQTHLGGVNWLKVLVDWKVWMFTLVFFCCDMGAASIASFTPTILAQLGWSAQSAQVMSIPIWIFSITLTLSSSYISGKLNLRYPFILFGICISLVGWSLQLAQVQPPGVRYFALYLIASGTFLQMPILIGWLQGNLRGRPAQAVGGALQMGLGNCANFVSANVFISTEAPKYPTGFSVGLAFTAVGLVAAVVMISLLFLHNGKVERRLVSADGDEWDHADNQQHYRYIL